MSRLIIKNLPPKVNADNLKEKFSKFGEVTDVQLKLTQDGRSRKFAFIGFKTSAEAESAMGFFNNTYYNSSKMCVELCRELGSEKNPKSWSKHTKHTDIAGGGVDHEVKTENIPKRINKTKNVDSSILEKLEKHKEDPEFVEFLEVNSGGAKVLNLLHRDDNVDDTDVNDSTCVINKLEQKIADAPISDLEYLKLKTKGTVKSSDLSTNLPLNQKPPKHSMLFTIKIRNLPAKVKKKDIKELLKPLIPASIRRTSSNSSCLAFIGFKTQKELRKSLVKNKSFLKGRQIQISEYIDRNLKQKQNSKWEIQENSLKNEETVGESGRIFLRNLPYSIKEDEIEELFSKYGPITEVLLPFDKFTRKGKGFGIVTFLMPEHAAAAYSALDGTIFQGRMLHLLPGKAKEEDEIEVKSYKDKKSLELKATAGSSHNWNSLFLGQNALVDLIADSYGTDKATVLSGTDGGVRMALGETQLVAETRKFLISNGVCLEAFDSPNIRRSKQIILVKNLPAKTNADEIRAKFEPFGILKRLVMPPTGITALVEFEVPAEAKAAFRKLAYSKFKNMPLYLEWGPENSFINKNDETSKPDKAKSTTEPEDSETTKKEVKENSDDDSEEPEMETTLFVKNLNFETSEDDLRKHFQQCGKLAAVTVSRKRDPSKPGGLISMGYGFVQFYRKSDLSRALGELQNSELQGHKLELKRSTKTLAVKPVLRRSTTNVDKQTGKKILVRNIPFQASKREIELLFKTFGELKTVRLPKKLVGTGPHRGFAFIEYVTLHDAKLAMKALCHSTHLYGRRLVLEWAEEEEDVETVMKRTAKHFHPAEAKRSKKAVADVEIEEDED